MKIRNGFVSNSSSSSFIVFWGKQPETAKEIQKILFKDKEEIHFYDYSYKTEELSRIIFKETQEITDEQINDMQDESYYFKDNEWMSTKQNNFVPHWETVGYKADPLLLKEYEEKHMCVLNEHKRLEEKLKKISEKDKNILLRKIKLSRLENPDYKLTEEEYELNNLQELYELNRDILWSGDLKKSLLEDSVKKFKEDHKDYFISHYEFSDNDGSLYSCLEHGDVFQKIKHEKFSHH
jgi:hypothetical protein